MSILQQLLNVIESHPDYTGSLETEDFPADFVQEVYEFLQENGDDLRQEVEGAYGHANQSGCLIIFPSGERWMVRYAGRNKSPLDIMVERDIDPVSQERFYQLVEQAYNDIKAVTEEKNSKRDSGWETIPLRHSKEVYGKACELLMSE